MKEKVSTVLVPLDGSKFAEWALPYAIDAANKLNAAIELLCVSSRRNMLWQWRSEDGHTGDDKAPDGGPYEYLKATAQKIGAVSSSEVLCTVLFGSAADAIVRHTKAHSPELVVMSSHGWGPMSSLWLGSVTDRVLRRATVPVLIVRPREGTEVDLKDRVDLRRILVALDGSPQAEASLSWASRIGSAATAYTLVRVESVKAPVWAADPESAVFYVGDNSTSGRQQADEYLQGVERRVVLGTERIAHVVMEGMTVVAGILQAADGSGADLIAITTHGRGRLPNLILGSVTDKVVRASSLPVLVVRRQPVENEVVGESAITTGEHVSRANTGANHTRRRSDLLSATSRDNIEVQWRYWS